MRLQPDVGLNVSPGARRRSPGTLPRASSRRPGPRPRSSCRREAGLAPRCPTQLGPGSRTSQSLQGWAAGLAGALTVCRRLPCFPGSALSPSELGTPPCSAQFLHLETNPKSRPEEAYVGPAYQGHPGHLSRSQKKFESKRQRAEADEVP